MHGFPKILKTKRDFERCHDMAINNIAYKKSMLSQWRGLLNSRNVYVFDRELSDGEDPDGPEPDYRVLEVEDTETEDVIRKQYILSDNPSARIYSIGFTVSEIEDKIAELEAK